MSLSPPTKAVDDCSPQKEPQQLSKQDEAPRVLPQSNLFKNHGLLGEGRFGSVFLVNRRETPEVKSALKIINTPLEKLAANHRHRVTVEMECWAAATGHAHIVALLGTGVGPDGRQWMDAEYVSGGTLTKCLSKHKRSAIAKAQQRLTQQQAPSARPKRELFGFSEANARAIVHQLLLAVYHLHRRGFVHRDIKPDNILYDGKSFIKLTDFGLAKKVPVGVGHRIKEGMVGSPTWMAPEAFDGDHDGFAADVWSCGVVLFQCLTTNFPFYRTDERQSLKTIILEGVPTVTAPLIEAGLSSDCIDFVRGTLNLDPARRLTVTRALNHPWFGGASSSSRGDKSAGSGNATDKATAPSKMDSTDSTATQSAKPPPSQPLGPSSLSSEPRPTSSSTPGGAMRQQHAPNASPSSATAEGGEIDSSPPPQSQQQQQQQPQHNPHQQQLSTTNQSALAAPQQPQQLSGSSLFVPCPNSSAPLRPTTPNQQHSALLGSCSISTKPQPNPLTDQQATQPSGSTSSSLRKSHGSGGGSGKPEQPTSGRASADYFPIVPSENSSLAASTFVRHDRHALCVSSSACQSVAASRASSGAFSTGGSSMANEASLLFRRSSSEYNEATGGLMQVPPRFSGSLGVSPVASHRGSSSPGLVSPQQRLSGSATASSHTPLSSSSGAKQSPGAFAMMAIARTESPVSRLHHHQSPPAATSGGGDSFRSVDDEQQQQQQANGGSSSGRSSSSSSARRHSGSDVRLRRRQMATTNPSSSNMPSAPNADDGEGVGNEDGDDDGDDDKPSRCTVALDQGETLATVYTLLRHTPEGGLEVRPSPDRSSLVGRFAANSSSIASFVITVLPQGTTTPSSLEEESSTQRQFHTLEIVKQRGSDRAFRKFRELLKPVERKK